jgi:hypothetical protein
MKDMLSPDLRSGVNRKAQDKLMLWSLKKKSKSLCLAYIRFDGWKKQTAFSPMAARKCIQMRKGRFILWSINSRVVALCLVNHSLRVDDKKHNCNPQLSH